MDIRNSNIAIIHDWFIKNSMGGAEKVTFLIDKFLEKNYSRPDLFSLVSNIDKKDYHNLKKRNIHTSLIESFPFAKKHVQSYLPILPFAIEQIDLRQYDFVISSSHSFAKGIITSPDQLHISYIHTPMRYAWDQMNVYLEQSKLSKLGFQMPIRYSLYKLRQWDFSSSQRVDYLISNSNYTAKRVKKYWGLESEVINPPVDIRRFQYNKNRGDFYLSVNRLVPNKRIDLLVSSFNKLGLPLIIIGDGPEKLKLIKMANSNITFLFQKSDLEVEEYMSRCRAFIYAGLDDFGIAPVEAMASGAPVIAFGKGGILDTVNCLNNCDKGKVPNGILFKKQTAENIYDTVTWFEEKKIWKKFNSETLNNYANKFCPENFISKLDFSINKAWNKFKRKLI
tara:strand:- start:221 stop:1402 length:1182 start_codon:yes stop_codon:yes gene_type:complete